MKIDKQTEAEHMAALEPMMKDEHPLVVSILVRDAWMLVAAIQFAATASDVSDVQRQWMTHVARQFQSAIAATHPEVAQILEIGWHREFDVDVEQGNGKS